MKQGRDTTQEERVQIVKDCLASGKDYGEMALKLQGKLPAGTHMDAAVRRDGLEVQGKLSTGTRLDAAV